MAQGSAHPSSPRPRGHFTPPPTAQGEGKVKALGRQGQQERRPRHRQGWGAVPARGQEEGWFRSTRRAAASETSLWGLKSPAETLVVAGLTTAMGIPLTPLPPSGEPPAGEAHPTYACLSDLGLSGQKRGSESFVGCKFQVQAWLASQALCQQRCCEAMSRCERLGSTSGWLPPQGHCGSWASPPGKWRIGG